MFAEDNAFSVMMRLTEKECSAVYEQLSPYGRDLIDHKFPCSDGGWVHYRVLSEEQLGEVKKILYTKQPAKKQA